MSRRRMVVVKDLETELKEFEILQENELSNEEVVEIPQVPEVPEVVEETAEVPEVVEEIVEVPEVVEEIVEVPGIPEEAIYNPIFSDGECSGVSLVILQPEIPETADSVEDFDKKIRDSIKSRNAPITELLIEEQAKPVEEEISNYRVSKAYVRGPKMPNSR
jgi:hypothetical protein